ncbi:uncharacterized protein LOC118456989 isoform X2 [Anopheles albimanus]|uniref:uncharacterized protein LOC118456989 isoform X2 n=1 Tax=Anopheles albimanus TaxID=7167 RepID=UPI00163E5C27|nr:uncharacterized protein LOC118456989 isoform X2 [Anopheles albimanus]
MAKMVLLLLQEIYCPEQIVIPENFHLTLKQYAKAVIRTQPFDLLRWSAAYFRCLALSVPPPVKTRYEPVARHGAFTAGALRVLIDQEDLLNVLSLVRMLNWSQLHWLKIVGVFIGLLCKKLSSTAEMICEMLTEDPDGGAASVPFWMFRECFVAVADLDCGSVQSFINGRKVLDEDTGALEEEQHPPALPKVLSTISFKNAIIDKYRAMLEHHDQEASGSESDENGQLSAVPSRLESDFKFFGDDSNVYEVLRSSPDFAGVLQLLRKLHKVGPEACLSQTNLTEAQLARTRERSRQIEELRATVSVEEYGRLKEQERLELLKEMGAPWLLLYLFSRDCCKAKSFNYVEKSELAEAEESASAYSPDSGSDEGGLGAGLGDRVGGQQRRKSSYSMPATMRARLSVCSHSAAIISNEILSKVVCSIDQAIEEGECELALGSISSFLERKCTSEEFIAPADHEKLQSFLQEAEQRDLAVKDLNELYNFFVSESFKSGLQEGRMMESTKEIFHIFGESGIEVDANLLEAKISDNMILGLVAEPEVRPPADEQPSEPLGEIPGARPVTTDAHHEPAATIEQPCVPALLLPDPASTDTPIEPTEPSQGEEATQTEPIEIACRQRNRSLPKVARKEECIAYKCKVAAIPGIGPPLSAEVRDAFLDHLVARAADQRGLIYPRNFRETSCPKID